MKPFLFLTALSAFTVFSSNPIDDACTCKGFQLYGKIKVVEHFPDLKVGCGTLP